MRRASGDGSTLSSQAEAPSAMPCCSCTRTAQWRPTTQTRCATVAELAAAFVALEGAPSRNHRAGPRLHRGDARRMAMRRARLVSLRRGTGRSPIRSLSVSRLPATAIALEPALSAYLHAVTANLISAGVRLIPLGQTEGQRLLAALEPIGRCHRRSCADNAARSARRRGVPRRHRQHAPRDAVHAAVPVVTHNSSSPGLTRRSR